MVWVPLGQPASWRPGPGAASSGWRRRDRARGWRSAGRGYAPDGAFHEELAAEAAPTRAPGRLQVADDPVCGGVGGLGVERGLRSEEHTSELQSLMRISYAVFCLKKKIREQHLNKPEES